MKLMRRPSSKRGGVGVDNNVGTSCSKVKKGPWTAEEDELLAEYVKKEGEGKWRTLPKKAGLLRCGKSCRLRWMNYLRPSVKRGHITPDEEDLILRLHRLLGNRWSLIAGRIPGRTDNEIKNYWNTHLTKKLISQGIDPKTHKPLNPINPSSIKHYSPSEKSVDVPISSVNNIQIIEYPAENIMIGAESKKLELRISSTNEGTILSSDDEDNDMIISSCFPDNDAFSSFLNSLINDDMFINNNQPHDDHQEQQQEEDKHQPAAAD